MDGTEEKREIVNKNKNSYRYAFVDANNGHCKTYTLFSSDKPITQSIHDNYMTKPSYKRLGECFDNFKSKLEEERYNISNIIDTGKTKMHGDEVTEIYGISGNY